MRPAGRKRHKVELSEPVESRSGTGDVSITYVPRATVMADILPLRGRQYYEARQVNAEVEMRIIIHYRTDIDENWRFTHGTKEYELVAPPVNVQMLGRELELMARYVT